MSNTINVLAELERIEYKYQWAGETTVKVCCPFHDDKNPSCSVDVKDRTFKCFTAGCNKSGDILSFIARVLKTTRAVVFADLSKRYALDEVKTINVETIERYHSAIWRAKPLLNELYARGLTDEDIRKYRLGEDRGRITIPVKNASGLYVNVRRYLPGAPGSEKVRNTKGHGTIRPFPIEQLEYKSVVVCAGEAKAIVAARELNKIGIGAVTLTGGEGNFPTTMVPHFAGKDRVWVCLDIDKEGQAAAQAACNLLSRAASWVGNIVLPLDIDQHPHGDMNDYVAAGGNVAALLENVDEWKPAHKLNAIDSEAKDYSLALAFTSEAVQKRIRVKAVVAAMDQTPYIIPAKVLPVCTRDQKVCSFCPVYADEGRQFEIPAESQELLEMVGAPKAGIRDACMSAVGVPKACRVVDFEPTEFYNIEDVRLSPELEITSRSTERAMLPAICVGKGLELNETYNLVGRMHPHPRTQQSTLVIGEYKVAQDALSSYQPTDLHLLQHFQPNEWTTASITSKLNGLYADLEANVTRIYQRKSLHLVVDLTYHSPLFITFDNRLEKGWVESIIVGDSSQGKSETTRHLMSHYGLGTKVECKNASVAGLLGGLQQIAGKWFVTWGIIPTHDKRLVVLEELKGAHRDVISKLTDMRSSGIAEIPKIEKRRTHARTRLIALSNPRSELPMSSYNYGIEVLPELIGGLEDIRRFDIALLIGASEIDSSELNKLSTSRPTVAHEYTSELCRALILWVWTRTPEQVIFEQESSEAILRYATKLCDKFTDLIPIIDRGSMRNKLARLAAALAGRTFSTDESFEKLIVKPCHVEFVYNFIVKTYSSPVFGYDSLTKAVKLSNELKDPDKIKHHIENTPFPKDFVESLLHTTSIEMQDIQDWCGWERNAVMQLVAFLVRKHALIRDGRAYRKTPEFIQLLKSIDVEDRPDYIPEDEF